MSGNARKQMGGNTRRLIVRERGDVRAQLLRKAIEREDGGSDFIGDGGSAG